jgi:hypothetical protein
MQALTGVSGLSGFRAAGGGGGATFQDTFNRSNSPSGHDALGLSSDGTKTWQVPDQVTNYSVGSEFGWAIRSNAATLTTLIGGLTVAYVTGLGAAGRAKVTVKTASEQAPLILLARYADHLNYVAFEIGAAGTSGQSLSFYTVVAGAVNPVASLSLDFVNYAAGDTLELELTAGNVAKLYWNGVQQGSNYACGVLTGNSAWGMAVNRNSLGDWDGAIEQYEWTAG